MIKEAVHAFKERIFGLNIAYNRVFDKKSPFTEVVLKDLAKFCRAHSTTFHSDPRLHAVLEGRREVWLKIQEHLNMNAEELYRLHTIKEINPRKE